MTNQDVVVPDMGIAAAAALPAPGRALFACRGAAGAAVSSLRGAYGGLGLPGGAAADGGEFLAAGARGAPAAAAAAANAPPGRTCTSPVVEAIRASSPTRCPAVDEYDAWTVSSCVRAGAARGGWLRASRRSVVRSVF
jgi:trehalose 6-phosphate phosphatase